MTRNIITEIACEVCGDEIYAPARKGFLGYKKANYPESWNSIQEDMCCEKCSSKIKDAISKAKDECRTKGSKKRKQDKQ